MSRTNTKKTVLSAVFLALGIGLPFLTGQIKEIGDTLLPMHLPVMLCGLVCGAKFGFAVGLILPFLRSVLTGMPPVYPNAVYMASCVGNFKSCIFWDFGKGIYRFFFGDYTADSFNTCNSKVN